MTAAPPAQSLVTLGITAFNAEQTIADAVRSALAQSWRPIEIIVVDDASTDRTPEILTALAAGQTGIRIIRQETNKGVGAARNRIVDDAQGAFIAFFDDDDKSHPERVARQIDRILKYERDFAGGAPVICHAARRQTFPDGGVHLVPTMGCNEGTPAPAGPPVAERILLGTPLENAYGACATCSQLARRETYRRLGGFDAAFRRSEDTEFNVRLALAGGHFVGIADPLVDQVMTPASEKSMAEEQRYAGLLLEKHRAVAEAAGGYTFARRWLDLRAAWQGRHRLRAAVLGARLMLRHPRRSLTRLSVALPGLRLNRRQADLHRMSGVQPPTGSR